jgi:ubiquitin conjugation factor E4 B
VPDQYQDPLLYTLMSDPVKLPSGVSVDRSTIVSHLLSDPTDPFNRAPLTVEDLVPDVELKAEIEAWIAERKNEVNAGSSGGSK